MKLSVISSNMTGIREIMDDSIDGILVPPKDETALAKAIIELIQNDTLREGLVNEARKKIER